MIARDIAEVRLLSPREPVRLSGSSARDGGAPTIHDVVRLWLERSTGLVLEGTGTPLARSTLASYRICVANLLEALPDVDASRISPLDVQRVISRIAEDHGPGSGKAAYHLLTMAWRYAVNVEQLAPQRCPTVMVRPPRVRKRREDWVPLETVREIYSPANHWRISVVQSRAIRLALLTGLRLRSDLLALRVGSVDYAGSCIRLRVQKAHTSAVLPVSGAALVLLREAEAEQRGGWLFPGRGGRLHNCYSAWGAVLDAVEALGFSVTDSDGGRLVPHHCRHARIAHCLNAGESAQLVGMGVGQMDPSSVQHYAGARISALRGPAETFAALVGAQGSTMETEPKQEPEATGATFPERLRAAMDAAGVNAVQLAAACGVEKQSVYGWLKGSSRILGASAVAVAKHLGVSTDYLLGAD